MTTLSGLRADLRTKLTNAGFFAFTIIPEKVSPPFVAVAPDDPYIAYEAGAGLSFGEAFVRHRLVLVVEAGSNDVKADALDALILQVLAIDFDPHQVVSVDEPGSIPINGQTHLGTSVNLIVPANLLEAP